MASDADVGMIAASESILISEATIPGQTTSTTPLYVALSATLLTLSIVNRRIRSKLYDLMAIVSRQVNSRDPEGARSIGAIRDGIRSTAAA